MSDITQYQEYIYKLKAEAVALGLPIQVSSSSGNRDTYLGSGAVYLLYNHYDYPTIIEEFKYKIAKRVASNLVTEKVTWYTDNL